MHTLPTTANAVENALVLCLSLVICVSVAAHADDSAALLKGRAWRCAGAESEEKDDPAEEGDTITFTDKFVDWRYADGRRAKLEYRIDHGVKPASIDLWHVDKKIRIEMRGIYRCDGRSLQICGRIGERGERIIRPTAFQTKRGDEYLRMLVFTVADAGKGEGDGQENQVPGGSDER